MLFRSYPQTTYPKGTTIEVTFPSTEFSPASFLYHTCYVQGALTTLKSCTYVPGTTRYTIVTDKKLEIEPGMDPLIFVFPHVTNFNEELSSGVIVVKATYDGVVLDDSGNGEENRKAETSSQSSLLSFSGFTFTPTTEGQTANYSVTLEPSQSFGPETIIQFEFPYEYMRGLGERVSCFAPEIQISATEPIKCIIKDWTINITNHKGYNIDALPSGFSVTISGIVNPNRLPAITDGISVFILTSESFAAEYVLSLGALSFTAAPQVMDITSLSTNDNRTRIDSDYSLTAVPSITTNPGVLYLDFPNTYEVQIFSTNPQLSINLGADVAIYPIANTIFSPLSSSITAGTTVSLTYKSISNPVDEGQQRYPVLYIIDTGSNEVQVRSYDNLIKPVPLEFEHGGELIMINDDEPATLIPG